MENEKDRLKKVIDSSGLSTLAFSKEIGLSNPQRIYNVLKGKNNLSSDLANKIAQRFDDITTIWLKSGSTKLNPAAGETQSQVSAEVQFLKDIIANYKERESRLMQMVEFLQQENSILKQK